MKAKDIFGEDNVFKNEPFPISIVCNQDNSELYFVEVKQITKLINMGLFDKIHHIKFPNENEIIKRINVIEQSCRIQKELFVNSAIKNFNNWNVNSNESRLSPWLGNIAQKTKHKI